MIHPPPRVRCPPPFVRFSPRPGILSIGSSFRPDKKMSKRQRTVSSSNEGPIDKRQKPDDEPADTRAAPPKVALVHSISDVFVEASDVRTIGWELLPHPLKLPKDNILNPIQQEEDRKLINNATGGRTLRARQQKEQTALSVEDESESTSEDEGGSVYGEVAKKTQKAKPISSQQRKLIKEILSIGRKDMKKSFNKFKISYCMDNPPCLGEDGTIEEKGDTDDSDEDGSDSTAKANVDLLKNTPSLLGMQARNGKRLLASTVKKKHLTPFGWRFEDLTSRKRKPATAQSFSAQDIYTPLSLEKSPIDWKISPFKTMIADSPDKANGGDDKKEDTVEAVKDGAAHQAKPPKPTDNIRKAWYWALEQINTSLLETPLEWAEFPESRHDRPEVPEDFQNLLEPEPEGPATRNAVSPCSSLDPTPVKRGPSQISEFRDKGLQLDIIYEQAESSSTSQQVQNEAEIAEVPVGVDLEEHSLPRQPSPGPFSDEASRALSSSASAPPKPSSRIPDPRPQCQLAEAYIKIHNLKLTKKDARRLEDYLSKPQREYDLEKSKRLLCQELGPVVGNRKSDPLGGMDGFVYVPIKDIEDRDKQNHTGNTARTANATDIHNTAMEMNLRWARFSGLKGGTKSEALIERSIGDLFTGLFSFDGLHEIANNALRFPRYLLLFSTVPYPDYGVRAGGDQWSHWPITLRPVVASGDNKKPGDEDGDTEARLACNMRPTLILEILMYLDTRPTADAPLPAWMWNYSWVCTSTGFIIYIHYPSPKLLEDGKDWKWTMVSLILTKAYNTIWMSDNRKKRLRAKSALELVVSHSSFVHDQILAWSVSRGQFAEGGIMNQLLARAVYEEGNINQLHEWARLLDSNYEAKY